MSTNLRLALFMIVSIALLHNAGMSSRVGGSGSCSTVLACVWVYLACRELVSVVAFVFGLGSMFLAVFLSRMIRFSCILSDFVMGRCSLMFVSLVSGLFIGHIVWARRW